MMSDCPLFTERHAQHSAAWTMPGYSIPSMCIACAMERLENRGELTVHVKLILAEFRALLGGNQDDSALLKMLSSDKRVLEHLCNLFYGLLPHPDLTVAQSSVNVLTATLLSPAMPLDIPRKLLQMTVKTVSSSHSFSSSLPYLNLLGQLLYSLPQLCSEVIHSCVGFFEFLLGGMAYPDESVKSSVVYIMVQLCSKSPLNSVPVSALQSICSHVSSTLATAKSHELTVNLLGLVKCLLSSGVYSQCLLQSDKSNSETKGSTLASALKRVLLSKDDTLQLAGVQCINELLTHNPQYGAVLMKADIAEFMFEALGVKNEALMSTLFSCLNVLASQEDFYSKCHIVYGENSIEPIIGGVVTALHTRNYAVAQLGFNILETVLKRYSSGMLFFNSSELLEQLVEACSTALQTESTSLVTETCSTLASVMKLCVDSLNDGGSLLVDSSVNVFLFQSFEESLLPAFLANMDSLEDVMCFKPVFEMARSLFSLCPKLSLFLAKRLSSSGFIQLSFDVKSKCSGAVCSEDLLWSTNAFLEHLCILLTANEDTASYLRGILQSALPRINCDATECLQLLKQRVGGFHDTLAVGKPAEGCSLQSLQAAVLALFYLAYQHEDILVSMPVLMQALNSFLSLNPDVHMLPPTTLTHLTVLYAMISVSLEGGSTQTESDASQILARGLIRISNPASLFVPNTMLMKWGFSQRHLENSVAQAWLLEWLNTVVDDTGSDRESKLLARTELIDLLMTTQSALETVLGFLTTQDAISIESVLIIVDHLILQEESQMCGDGVSHVKSTVFSSLQEALLTQRLNPLPDSIIAAIFEVLVKQLEFCKQLFDLKFVYQVAVIVTRSNQEDGASCKMAFFGMKLLYELLQQSMKRVNTQVPTLLLNDAALLRKIASFVPCSSAAESHTQMSASALQLIALFSESESKIGVKVTPSGAVVHLQSLIASLMATSTFVQVAGLQVWRVLFSNEGVLGGCFTLQQVANNTTVTFSGSRHLKTVIFLIQNCLAKERLEVRVAASACFTEFLESFDNQMSDAGSRSWDSAVLSYKNSCQNDANFSKS